MALAWIFFCFHWWNLAPMWIISEQWLCIHESWHWCKSFTVNCWFSVMAQMWIHLIKQGQLLSLVGLCVPWLTHMCDMTHPYMWHAPIICVTWLIYVCVMANFSVCHDSFICVTWLIHVWHDSFICVTWLIHVWHDSFICVTWRIHMCDMTHSYVWHD